MLRALTRIQPRALPRTSLRAPVAARAFSTTLRARSDDHHGPPAPQLYGPGAKSEDKIPTDEEQATGLERYQLLGKMEGIDVFGLDALESGRLGTMKDPIKVPTIVRDFSRSWLDYHPHLLTVIPICLHLAPGIIGVADVS